ncbi:MAG: alpha/beta fold hydrolase [Acidimicrobiaceae bacterium]|nr:alpha/beta hydrolase [Acidimicrobiaceae bacterium]MDE0517259.1 alpha/beta hydrolase [Acidimicrobiaceae bacterium]MDE0656293.1 alpha/beta hydrolase [Acidimicrobiaceae bacterium]MXZ96689.1 alpha/beta fold hydrolase [Acidimicrobiaceae bacterium]MYF42731.1 alpha/beta fold hydrolase [Acidimicrobiaceae bacterium]
MPFVNLPTGIEMYYQVEGTGDPLLLIMGTAADHTTWAAQVDAYRHRYTVITYDARGTGRSTHPPDVSEYSMRILADDAAALCDSLGVERAHVSGLSLGSATAQELAINHPGLVSTLQLHCTWGRSDEWFIRMIDTNETYILHDDPAGYIRTALLWVASPTFINDQPADVEAFERGFILENPHPPSKAGMLGHFHADKTHDTLDRLGSIEVPTLITSGEVDWQVPTRYGLEVQRAIEGSTMHVFRGPHSSHIAFHEMVAEWNAFTLGWLDRQSRIAG